MCCGADVLSNGLTYAAPCTSLAGVSARELAEAEAHARASTNGYNLRPQRGRPRKFHLTSETRDFGCSHEGNLLRPGPCTHLGLGAGFADLTVNRCSVFVSLI